MNEQLNVNQAFNPDRHSQEQLQAEEDFRAYLATRPTMDEATGQVHHPADGSFIHADTYFDEQRQAAALPGQKYEDMSTAQLAKKLARADYNLDQSTGDEVGLFLRDKFEAQADETADQKIANWLDMDAADIKKQRYSEVELDQDLDIAENKRWSRLMKLYDREFDRLEANEEFIEPEPESPTVELQEAYDTEDDVDFRPGWKRITDGTKKLMSQAAEYIRNGGEKLKNSGEKRQKAATAIVIGALATTSASYNALTEEIKGAPLSGNEDSPQTIEGLQQDPRLDADLIEAFKGDAHLAGEQVKITGYAGSRQIENSVQHFIEYTDSQGEKKFTTLDQFLWMDLPQERRKELEDAGVNPYDLVAGTDPILKPNTKS